MSYCTLADAIRHLRAGKSSANLAQAVESGVLLAMIRRTPRIDNMFTRRGWRYFEPNIDTVAFELRADMINSIHGRLALPDPLLELTGVKVGGTEVSEASLLPHGVTAGLPTPYWALYLNSACKTWYSAANCNPAYCLPSAVWVQVSGTWGMSREYATAWQDEDNVQIGISAAATTITVADADGLNYESETPRFSPGQLLKINSEYMRIDAVDETANELTVRRARNGSTAATHSIDDTIYVWYPDRGIREEYARQAAMWYSRIGSFNTAEINAITGGEVRFPSDLMASLKSALQGYIYG